jgi:protease-4
MFGGGAKPLAPKTTLVLDLKGELVEESSGSARDSAGDRPVAAARHKMIQLRDVLSVLDAAAKDPNIGSGRAAADELEGGGLASLREVGAALDRVKAAGKPVVAWGGSYDQKRYLLAAHASEVYMHPMGMVLIEGFGRYRNYYRDALDKLGVTVNLLKVGTYKSFAEPYIGNGPSQAASEADSYLYNALWTNYTRTSRRRASCRRADMKTINELPQQHGGGQRRRWPRWRCRPSWSTA